MSLTACFLAALVVLPALGLVTWAWWSLGRPIDDEGLLRGFEGLQQIRQDPRACSPAWAFPAAGDR